MAVVDDFVGRTLVLRKTDAGDVAFEKVFRVGFAAARTDVNFYLFAAGIAAVGQHLFFFLNGATQLEGMVAVERLVNGKMGYGGYVLAVDFDVDVYFTATAGKV